VKILKNSLSRILRKLESPTLTGPERIQLLRCAKGLEQKISLTVLNAESTIVGLRFFNQQMQALINVVTGLGDDITEAKLRERLEPLGMGTSSSESTVPAESIINALQSLSLTNTQGSSPTPASSNAQPEKDETDKNGMNKN
jgi:hypothetical protein